MFLTACSEKLPTLFNSDKIVAFGDSLTYGYNVAPEHYDLAMTLYWSLATNLPEMLGAFAGGFVIEAFGYPMLFLSYSIFPLVACILCLTNKKHFK